MTQPVQDITELEAALLERANRQAEDHRLHARRIRERILQEEQQRLHLREQHEVLAAKETAEHIYRQRVQASELALREKSDHWHWQQIQSVVEAVNQRLEQLVEDEVTYLPELKGLLIEAAGAFSDTQLVAEFNQRDLERLKECWPEFSQQLTPDKEISLHPEPRHCLGGVLVRDRDNRVRLDNTFEGRLERLADELHRRISRQLFGDGST